MAFARTSIAVAVSLLVCSAAAPLASSKTVKLRGYITQVSSPTTFEIEDYRITRDSQFDLDFENAGPDLKFMLQDLRVGVEVELVGVFDDSTGELHAKSMKVDLDQFRLKPLTAIISRPPAGISRSDNGWSGVVWADGQQIHVTSNTRVMFRPTKTEKQALKRKVPKEVTDEDGDPNLVRLQSLDQIAAGMSITYQGRRDPSTGIINADRLTFSRNDLESGEAKLWQSLKVTAQPGNALNPGDLKISKVGKFKLLPSEHVQQYVRSVGQSLIPAYQRDLPVTDPRHIAFQWYVVRNKEANAFALANGTVVVFSGLLDTLENEAQLAAVVGHEMAHATQQHTWRELQFHKTERIGLQLAAAVASAYGKYNLRDVFALTEGAIRNGYSRNLENQADRVGLEYMIAAGYDLREAPRVWKQMAKRYGSQPTDFFWSSHDNNATRRSYLMNELRNNYQGLEYSSLKVNAEEFLQIQQEARQVGTKTKVIVR
jgi:hypothetical protein